MPELALDRVDAAVQRAAEVERPVVTVALLQIGFEAGGDRAGRTEQVLAALAAAPPAELIVLPELWDVGYFDFDAYASCAEPLPTSTVRAVAAVAADRGCTVVAGSVIERSDAGMHNTTVVIGPDGVLLGTYRKWHLFGYRSREAELLTPGTGPVVIGTPVGRLGLATCFDLRFPDQFAAMRRLGADILVVPAAWPAARAGHWQVLVPARAIETQTPIVAVNGVGENNGVALGGHSLIVSARGVTLLDAAMTPGVHTAQIDLDDTSAWRQEFPLDEHVHVG